MVKGLDYKIYFSLKFVFFYSYFYITFITLTLFIFAVFLWIVHNFF